MSTLLIILLGTVLIQNSATLSAAGAGAVLGTFQQELRRFVKVSLSLTLASVLGFAVQTYALTPLELGYLRTVVLAVLLGIAFALTGRWRSYKDSESEGLLAYFTEHCAIWGMALFSAWNLDEWSKALSYGIGAGALLSFLDAAFRAHRSRFATAAVPFVFRGIPLDLITAGLMALALYGFIGF